MMQRRPGQLEATVLKSHAQVGGPGVDGRSGRRPGLRMRCALALRSRGDTWPGSLRYVAHVSMVTGAYVLGGVIGLDVAFANRNVTAVWPPTGISVAALLVLGWRVLPGIALGAFFTNLLNGAGAGTSALFTVGNTLAPLLGALLVSWVSARRTDLGRVRDVVAVVVLGGMTSMVVSATLGTASLALTRQLAGHSYWSVWSTWWVGDSIGVILVAPLVLAFATRSWRNVTWRRRNSLEVALVLVAIAGVCELFFATHHPVQFLAFPVVAWAAVRFLQLGAVLAVGAICAVSTIATLGGSGPFASGLSATGSLMAVQLYNGTLVVTALVLAATSFQARRAEGALMSDAIELEATVAERTRALELSLADLRSAQDNLVRSERLAAVGELAVVVGHELRNPLTAVTNCLYLIGRAMGDHPPEPVARSVALAEREVQKAVALVEDLTSFVRPRPPSKERFDAGSVVAEVLEATPPPRGVSVSVEARGVELVADRRHVSQAVTNLLANAYQALADGGTVVVAATSSGAEMAITVTDSGPGVSESIAERVFEPFFTTKETGTGLGLAIVRRLVETNGGSISLENRNGGGLCVTLRFPGADQLTSD